MEQSAAGTFICPNCSTEYPAAHHHCHHCGQATHLHDDTFWGMIVHFLGHYFHYESKFWVTMRTLVTRPGALTVAYRRKQRMRYVPPVTLFIFITIVAFLVTTAVEHLYLSLGWDQNVVRQDLVIKGTVGWDDILRAFENAYVLERLTLYGPKFFFIIAPFFGLFLHVFLHRNKDVTVVDHLVFSMHFHSFFFVVVLIIDFIPEKVRIADHVFLGLMGVCAAYLVLAIRQVYALRLMPAVLVAGATGLLYVLFFFLVLALVIYLILLQQVA